MGVHFIFKNRNFGNLGLGKIQTPQEFIDATALTSSTEKSALGPLVDKLIAGNVWAKSDAIYPFVGSSENAHKFNLKDPRDLDAAYRISWQGTGRTHDSLGFNGHGTGWGKTFLLPSSVFNKHLYFYNTTPQITSGIPFGAMTTVNSRQIWLSRYFSTFGTSALFGGNPNIASTGAGYPTTETGSLFAHRSAPADLDLYANGVQIATETGVVGADVGANTNPICIGGILDASGAIAYRCNITIGFATVGASLSDAERLALHNAVEEFQIAIGRA